MPAARHWLLALLIVLLPTAFAAERVSLQFRWISLDAGPDTVDMPDADGTLVHLEKRVILTEADIADARAAFDPATLTSVVNIWLTQGAAARFADETAANVTRRLAIVIDGRIVSTPVVNEAIRGGTAVISGRFTSDQASNLAAALKSAGAAAPQP